MKIGQPPDIAIQATQVNSANAQKAGQGAKATATTTATQTTRSSGVSVTVSTLARSLEKPQVNSSADVDTQKVESIRASIRDGSYTVNPEAIADKLLSNARELLQRTTR